MLVPTRKQNNTVWTLVKSATLSLPFYLTRSSRIHLTQAKTQAGHRFDKPRHSLFTTLFFEANTPLGQYKTFPRLASLSIHSCVPLPTEATRHPDWPR